MPFYLYECPSCDHVTEIFAKSHKLRKAKTKCEVCNGVADYVIAPTHTHFHFTQKEVRVPSDPVKTTVPGNYSMTVDNYKIVPSPPEHKKQLQKNGRYLPYDNVV